MTENRGFLNSMGVNDNLILMLLRSGETSSCSEDRTKLLVKRITIRLSDYPHGVSQPPRPSPSGLTMPCDRYEILHKF